ncbi:glycosyltransferase family 4 protein [uncultured Polaribacter sp.]|uniref:glycosyltransferase family 4 protein n=1 Tax=uncultured Polaribacter sp. TaxID=174711 RepID=UPI00261C31B1|nr:glycosyltransferase family 4 protein [uncultured Polaribacter sp.]
MNIGFITPEYPHEKLQLNVGGIGSFINNFACKLSKSGHNVIIFIYNQQKNEVFYDNNIEIHLIKQKVLKPLTWWFNRKHIQNYINKIVVSKKIDIIEAPDWTGITAFMTLKCPLIIRLHGSDTYFCNLENRKQKKKNFYFEKKALFKANKIVGVSNFVAKETKKLFKIDKEIVVLHNSIDSLKFKPNLNKREKENTILYFGTLIRKKGVLELALIFNQIIIQNPNVKLILLGKDTIDVLEKKSTLELFYNKLSRESKKNISYISEVSYNDVLDYISEAEVVVLPSFAEAFPMTWLEAMSMEKKMVVSNIGWSKELMIDGVTGFIENPTNHQGFANKIIYLLNNKKKGNEMAKKARERIVNEFDIKRSTLNNIKLYKSLK